MLLLYDKSSTQFKARRYEIEYMLSMILAALAILTAYTDGEMGWDGIGWSWKYVCCKRDAPGDLLIIKLGI